MSTLPYTRQYDDDGDNTMMMESEHILEFIDGSLDEDVEQQLFDAMARQPELRTTCPAPSVIDAPTLVALPLRD